jgi:hypothetical protein
MRSPQAANPIQFRLADRSALNDPDICPGPNHPAKPRLSAAEKSYFFLASNGGTLLSRQWQPHDGAA